MSMANNLLSLGTYISFFTVIDKLVLTLSLPILLRLYTLPYWSYPPFSIFDIRALWCTERPNVKN